MVFYQFVKKYLPLICLLLVGVTTSVAQHQEIFERPKIWRGKDKDTTSSGNLLKAFKNGHFDGHFRYFYMQTDNAEGLLDFYAHAAGGGLRYATDNFYGFKFRLSGFYIFNIGSTDLTLKDPVVKQGSRYEIGLFDLEDPGNHHNLDRLEELLIEYHVGKSMLKFGKMLVNTPFINLQDGRMRPTGVQGLWFYLNELDNVNFQGGWLYAISPRSTTRWMPIGQSLGINPVGVDVFGRPSGYAGQISSKGVFVLGNEWEITQGISTKLWNYYFENVFNLAMFQVDIKKKLSPEFGLISGGQFVRQDALNDGGNPDPEKAYIEKGGKTITFGLRLGLEYNRLKMSLNYNHISSQGRFLMPREWGREPFYTFLPRERNEGLGDVRAYMLRLDYKLAKQPLNIMAGYGYYDTPDVLNFRLNKYGLPDYTQLNVDLKYTFKGMLEGLDAHILYVYKANQGELHNNRKYEFNKVNMHQYNFVLNFHF